MYIDDSGPIVRIGPNELHVSDPEFFEVLHGSSQRRNKDTLTIGGFGQSHSHIATVDHDHHRLRRRALNPFFSTQSITKLEPVIRAKIESLSNAFVQALMTRHPVNLDAAVMALTTDIITEYAFSRSYNHLEQPDFSSEWTNAWKDSCEPSMLFRYAPFLVELIKVLPLWLIKMLDPNIIQFITVTLDLEAQITAAITDRAGKVKSSQHSTIFHELLNSNLPDIEKTIPRLADEGYILIGAGSTPTAHFLKSTIFFVLADPIVLQHLKAELVAAIPDPRLLPSTHVLEHLPYLSAVFKEGSRLVDGASSRLARIAPDSDLQFREYSIPRGTSISMSTYIQHRNTDLFPDPEKFKPERWLGQDSSRLEHYLVNFSKGTRSCLGMNLAKTEIYLTLAMVFRRFDLELFETDRSDVDMAHDFFVPYARLDSVGVRVVVKHCVID